MKSAFTILELIFIIVIIGIIATIAISKLSATRDDALIVQEMANFRTCKADIQNSYTATGDDGIQRNTSGVMTSGPASCEQLKCFVVDGYGYSSTPGQTIFKASLFAISNEQGKYCKKVFDNIFPEYKNLPHIPPIFYNVGGSRIDI